MSKGNTINEAWLKEHGYVPDGEGGWRKAGYTASIVLGKDLPIPQVTHSRPARVSASNDPSAKMNKTEAAYAAHLETLKRAGEITAWAFEPEKLRLADKTFYTPDFRIVWPDGRITFDETKGHWEDDARVKIKVVAHLHPYQFRAVKRDGNGWKYETFNNA